jgi:hypothetical protein
MRKLKIGYAPYSQDLNHPADRRRIVHWAKHRGHEITLDVSNSNDLNILTNRADFTGLIKKIPNVPVIFDMVDGYLGPEVLWKDWGRGFSKVITKQLSSSVKPYRQLIIETCQQASAVVCSTVEQKETISPYNKNVHTILDFHEEFPLLRPTLKDKNRIESKLVWEGFPYTIKGLRLLENAFANLDKSMKISLDVVTDLTYPKYLGAYAYRPTSTLLGDIPTILGRDLQIVNWTIPNLVNSAKRASLAVLPLDPSGSLNSLKAENRLLIFWRLGIPVIASPSLAYRRVMKEAGIDGICFSENDWEAKILDWISNPNTLFSAAQLGQSYLHENHNEKLLFSSWDNLIESVL